MKLKQTWTVTLSLLLVPAMVLAQNGMPATEAPPIEQVLVREGDYARRLVQVLRLDDADSEVEAEERLAGIGIAPSNGWIADYPMTPDVTMEVQEAVTKAAELGQLPLSSDEALVLVQNLNSELGLSIYCDAYAADVAGGGYGQYYDEGFIQDYYYDYGPPVVTYYPPPWDYTYLYSWVPYSFWWGSFGFAGFFILNDFHRVVVINRGIPRGHPPRYKMISNHYMDRGTGRFKKVDPLARYSGDRQRHAQTPLRSTRHASSHTKGGAASILSRSTERYQRNPAVRGITAGISRGTQLQSRPGANTLGSASPNRSSSKRFFGYSQKPVNRGYRSNTGIAQRNRSVGQSRFRTHRTREFGVADKTSPNRGFPNRGRSIAPSGFGKGGGARSFGGSSGGFRGASRGGGFRGHGGGCRGRC